MKKLKILITLLTLTLVLGSCETYDDYNTDRKTVISFDKVNPREGTNETNKIKVPEGGSDLRNVQVFASDQTNADRTFNVIVVDSLTAVAPENYNFSSTVTIPANQRRGILVFNVTEVSITDDYQDVAIAIEGVTGSIVPGVPFILQIKLD